MNEYEQAKRAEELSKTNEDMVEEIKLHKNLQLQIVSFIRVILRSEFSMATIAMAINPDMRAAIAGSLVMLMEQVAGKEEVAKLLIDGDYFELMLSEHNPKFYDNVVKKGKDKEHERS